MKEVLLVNLYSKDLLRALEQQVKVASELVGPLPPVDEVALLLPWSDDYQAATRALVAAGFTLSAVATDAVDVAPFGSCYDVEYSFFQAPFGQWRIELMRITDGVSPLHAPYIHLGLRGRREAGLSLPVVHYSFKLPGEVEYSDAKGLLKDHATLAQECESGYGRFSYWADRRVLEMVYLKPRVNLRDEWLGLPPDVPQAVRNGFTGGEA